MKKQLKQFCLLACVRETYANSFPFLADQRSSRKIASSEQKAFCVLQFAKTESAITVQRASVLSSFVNLQMIITFLWYHQLETIGYIFLWLFPQLEESEPNSFIRQQDGTPPLWYLSARDWLNITVPSQ
ncbi:uncharacterized protein TNCV_5124891 [Trichonephila clavipes]|nr:uncharacterized protein TNCV_5124891 [Trichonephila clavipes]